MSSTIQWCFTIKDLGNVKFFLSMLVEQDQGRSIIYLSQRGYLDKALRRFPRHECKGCATPINIKVKLHSKSEGEEAVDKVIYQEAVKSGTYAPISTGPDIVYATGLVGLFSADPSILYSAAININLPYVIDSLGLRIHRVRSNDRGFGGRERGKKQSQHHCLRRHQFRWRGRWYERDYGFCYTRLIWSYRSLEVSMSENSSKIKCRYRV